MVNFLDKVKIRRRGVVTKEESGNTLVMYIMFFPLVFGVFGLAVDTTVATYTQASLQSSLDAATQSALSRAVNPGTEGNRTSKPTLTTEKAQAYVTSFYDISRAGDQKSAFVKCQTSITQPPGEAAPYPTAKVVTPPSGCSYTQGKFAYSTYNGQATISVAVVEKSSTVFINIIGIDEFKYDVKSESRITYEVG